MPDATYVFGSDANQSMFTDYLEDHGLAYETQPPDKVIVEDANDDALEIAEDLGGTVYVPPKRK